MLITAAGLQRKRLLAHPSVLDLEAKTWKRFLTADVGLRMSSSSLEDWSSDRPGALEIGAKN